MQQNWSFIDNSAINLLKSWRCAICRKIVPLRSPVFTWFLRLRQYIEVLIVEYILKKTIL